MRRLFYFFIFTLLSVQIFIGQDIIQIDPVRIIEDNACIIRHDRVSRIYSAGN